MRVRHGQTVTPRHTPSATPDSRASGVIRGPWQSHAATDEWAPTQGRGDSRSRLLRSVSLAIAVLFASPALAQQTETDAQSAERYFDRLDQKKQGFFTLADMQRVEGKAFKRTDDNKDGVLTLSEYIFGIPDDRQDVIDRFTRRYRLADADNNGGIQFDEYMDFCARVIAAADTNQDGMVTKEEFIAASSSGSAE
jgi:Ca2+-binding EF-hand superfamily protein